MGEETSFGRERRGERPQTVLIVEEDRSLRSDLEAIIRAGGFVPVSAGTYAEALQIAEKTDLGVALLDMALPDGFAENLAADLKSVAPDCVCTMVSDVPEPDYLVEEPDVGGCSLLEKPVRPRELLRYLDTVFHAVHLKEEKRVAEEKLRESEARFRTMEIQLAQAQKMEAIGTVAGGIAHDFNNILSAIVGYSELARLDIPRESPARAHLDAMLKATGRATDLVKQILAFSRQDAGEARPIELGTIVKECLRLVRASLPSTVLIQRHIDSRAGPVVADPTQIHQVLMNLTTNAAHSMERAGGRLVVGLEGMDFTGGVPAAYGSLRPGRYVVLSVRDTGCGMDEATLPQIFDPYFTTKEKGVGTGLGLAVVHGIVSKAGGAIAVESELGRGTTFRVAFPRSDMHSEAERTPVADMPAGDECILFVDDEGTLVSIGTQVLEKLGYTVIARTSSLDALEAFRANAHRIDLVITDLTMPHMTGDRLAREIAKISADVPVIVCSGFAEALDHDDAKAMGISEFLMKPLLMRDLAVTIRKVLDG